VNHIVIVSLVAFLEYFAELQLWEEWLSISVN